MDRGDWRATVQWGLKEYDTTEHAQCVCVCVCVCVEYET